jgi:hypothetical protein
MMMMCLVQEAEEEEAAVEGEQEEEETGAEGEVELRAQAVGGLQSVEVEEPEEEQEEGLQGLHLLMVVEEIKPRMLCLWILSRRCTVTLILSVRTGLLNSIALLVHNVK